MLFLSVHIFFPLPTSPFVFFLPVVSRYPTRNRTFLLSLFFTLLPLFTTPVLTIFILFARSPFITLFTRHTRSTVRNHNTSRSPTLLHFTSSFYNACTYRLLSFLPVLLFLRYSPATLAPRFAITTLLARLLLVLSPTTIPHFYSFHPSLTITQNHQPAPRTRFFTPTFHTFAPTIRKKRKKEKKNEKIRHNSYKRYLISY